MKKRIALPVILVPFLVISLIFAVGCKAPWSTPSPQYPKMTAPEVCQYVNQALRNEYISISSTTRYEVRYTALSAVYGEVAYGTEVADEEMNRLIKTLSPGALRSFREQLRKNFKTMTPQERENALRRLRGLTEVEDIVLELEGIYSEGRWLVNVKVVTQEQKLRDGQWVVTSVGGLVTQQYYFSEITGALTKR